MLRPFLSLLASSFCLPALSPIFHSKTLHDTSVFSSLLVADFYLTGHSPVFVYNTALHCLPCAASRVGGGWDPGGWGPPWGPIRFFGSDFSYWAIQAGLLTPLTSARHRLSPLAAFTSGADFLQNGRRWQWICEFHTANIKGIFGGP